MHLRSNPILNPELIKRINLGSIGADLVTRRREALNKRELKVLFRKESGKDFVGEIRPGFHLFGFSNGQFSLIDVIRALIAQLPHPIDFTLSSWTAAQADIGELHDILNKETFSRVRFLFDVSFQRRQPEIFSQIRNTFGGDCVRITHNHAKFMLLKAGKYRIVCRTSMNLNMNLRLEDIELKDDFELYEFIDGILENIFENNSAKKRLKQTRELGSWFTRKSAKN